MPFEDKYLAKGKKIFGILRINLNLTQLKITYFL